MKTQVASSKSVLTDPFSEPLNDATSARIDIHAGDGNLAIDGLTGGEPVLASGTLQYFEKQGLPKRTLASSNGQATLTLKGGAAGQTWFHLPWAACNGATEWQIHLNPAVSLDLTAHSDGGNVRLDLSGLAVTRLLAETGGGNLEVVLPDHAENLSVTARTGAGNVTIRIPGGFEARIQATTGLGKVIMDPRFSKLDKDTYQSPGFESAAQQVEITAASGAGNVIVSTS